MPGFRLTRIVSAAPTAAPYYIWQKVTAGSRIVSVAGRDASKGSTRVTLLICTPSDINISGPVMPVTTDDFPYMPLNGTTTQGGQGDWVTMTVQPFTILQDMIIAASFADPAAADLLNLSVGVEV